MAATKQKTSRRNRDKTSTGRPALTGNFRSPSVATGESGGVTIHGARRQPFARAESVRRKVGFTQQEFAVMLGINPRTYSRRAEDEELKSGESLQVEMVDRILEEAARVFRDEGLARKWLQSPIIGLDNRRPIDHLDSIEGYERVKDTLGKIEYGMY